MRLRMRSTAVSLVVCLYVIVLPASATLRVGVARVDITPEKPVQMSGYASRKDLSTGVHDPLSARVLMFEQGGDKLVLVSADVIGYYAGTADYLRRAILEACDLEPRELFLTAIHTHAAPTLTCDVEHGHPNNVAYTETFKSRLIEAIQEAIENAEPAQLGVATGSCPVGSNRREVRIRESGESDIVLGRNPYGSMDKEVLVLKVARPDDELVALAFDYATHATSLGPRNYVISGDVLGLAEQFVEKVMGPDVVAPAFAGASGDIDPWFRILPEFNTESGWIPEPVLLGTFLGEEVVHVSRRAEVADSDGPIKSALATLTLPPKQSDESDGDRSSVSLNVTVGRVGDVAFVGLGAEVFSEIGMAIKAGSPCKHTFVITHCNGAAGYLAPGKYYVEGGYEIRSSPFAPQAAEIVVRRSLHMLHNLYPAAKR
ncbi:MAG: neutral/alkaline non-lysosomal ceramidase N-terminal domain-containing protein [Phycisphaerales bacterium]|nr:MAG: neutral/alkaline non-lysosomal ceramidase N-terminal domain-containing protein [Phycisphaerales bacterium]